jgi:quinoprotein dehydrogenase-associated probable ABC transporter substrate-binding protein
MRLHPALLGLAAALLAGPALAQQEPSLVAASELRVCADPHDLPLSDEHKQGYENRIAELVGRELRLPVTYTWYPDSQGFVRATLFRHRCDVVMGTVAGAEGMDGTQAYYHTGYVMVTRAEDNITTNKVSDPALAGRRFGIIARTPPTDLVVRHNLLDQTTSYDLVVDTRVEQPSHQMLLDLLARKIDVALLWGPFAGYYIKHDHLPLRLAFIAPEDGSVRLDYHIAMGVRPGDVAFRRRLNEVVRKDADRITAILQEYGVPLLDEQNQPLQAAARITP